MAEPVEAYLTELRDIHRSGAGVEETSYYTSLSNLLNEIGRKLRPRVRCIINIQNAGAGLPDGGLFTPEQFPKSAAEPPAGQIPTRGAIEVKGANENIITIADTKQVREYLGRYRQVLVTNYREFLLLGHDQEGRPAKLESYCLADDARGFWSAVAHPREMAGRHGERLTEYLKRAMLRPAELVEPKDVAWFLASYAREAKARVEARKDLPELAAIRSALEEALGMKFEGEKGEHFFRSTLVQTLFYGIFSAWVLWHKQNKGAGRTAPFNWHEAIWYLHVPMINVLFQQISSPAQLGPLDVAEVLDWAGEALNRVNRGEFFGKFEEGQAVQYFYEPFLRAFDPELRKELGVWYTPPEIIQYMVARVDAVLREELDIADGLADPSVYILDPCCGTGAYLVEALKRIAATLKEKGNDALLAHDLKRAATTRVFGFEILPAPFVISHLQLGLLLQSLGAPLLDEHDERAGVYLTNALTGWEPPEGVKRRLPFPEMEEERDAADRVKQEAPILVVLGNPPYNAFAGVSPEEEQGLVEPYKQGLKEWGITKNYLDDLYVRFFRLAERRIAEKAVPGRGVVSYISNHSWVSDPSFVVLRKHLLESFDRFWIENMHGNRKISEYAPDGRTSETIFAIPGFSVGIQQGVAISCWVRSGRRDRGPQVLFRDDLNAAKAVERRAQLLATLQCEDFDAHYQPVEPTPRSRFSFRPSEVPDIYFDWPTLVHLSATDPLLGLNENRGGALQDVDKDRLEGRMRLYFDSAVGWAEIVSLQSGLSREAAGFGPEAVRNKALGEEQFDADRIVRYVRRPFDVGWAYLSDVSPLWNRSRPELRTQLGHSPWFMISRPAGAASPEGVPVVATRLLGEQDWIRGHAYYFPIQVRPMSKRKAASAQTALVAHDATLSANLSQAARAYLAALGVTDPDGDAESASLIWMHALAITYAPEYLTENADGISQNWPRVPLPDSKGALLASAALGRQVAALLDTESPMPGVTAGKIRKELRLIGVISREGGGSLNLQAGELAVTAGWGHAGRRGVTMPAKGKTVPRGYSAEEMAAISEGATESGLSAETAMGRLGKTTRDVYLNSAAYWRNVPEKVWKYTIGGYQVIKKWLSYRERDLLGRSLTMEEAREVMNIARRIAAILLLESELDDNYRRVKGAAFRWVEVSNSDAG